METVLNCRRILYLTTAALLAASGLNQDLHAQPAFFPLKDLRQGMHGTGRTVFSGDKVEDFQVEILGVLENSGPKQSIILARLSGGPLEKTGVMQGMSGSPVYIDGRLVGAVAMAFPFSKEPIAGIRPIEEMVAQPSGGKVQAGLPISGKDLLASFPKREARGTFDSKLIDIATPVSFSGFSAGTLEHFAPQLRSLGLEPRQGVSGGASTAAKMASGPLQPGSMISVQLASGDLSIGADGTVTHIDGNRIYAFGHRFLSVGSTELPFARASVITLLANLSSSFKISSSGEWLGAITSDHNTAVAGELGRRPRMVPLSIAVNSGGKKSTYQMEIVNDRLLSPLLMQMAMYSALDSTERTLGPSSIGLHGTVEFENGPEPVRFDNIYAGDFNTPLLASLATAMPVAYALQNNLDSLSLKRINLEIDSFPQKKQMQIDQVWASKRVVHPGEQVEVAALLAGENGSEVTKRLTYTVPIGAPLGTLYFTVADGSTTNSAEARQFSVTQPRPAVEIVSFLNGLRGNRKGYLRVWRADPSYLIDGYDMPDPPPSVSMILARGQMSPAAGSRPSTVAEMEFSAGDVVVSGSKTIQVEVKE
ncbi:MAG: SpoIVB peptidase S55 domain-containing protein [Bryobacteraceae bacterium]